VAENNHLKTKEDNLGFLEQFFSGELAFYSLLGKEFDKVKYFNQVNKELLKKGLLNFEKKERNQQLKLIENTNLYLELEDFLAFKTKLVRMEDPQEDIEVFLKNHEKWVSVSRFRHFESCVNTFLFRENIFNLLDSDVQGSALHQHLQRLKLKNFCAHAQNLKELGYVDYGLKQVEKASKLLKTSDLKSPEWVYYLETMVGLKMKEFSKRKGAFTLNALVQLQKLIASVREYLNEDIHKLKSEILELEITCLYIEENPNSSSSVNIPLNKVISIYDRIFESYEPRLLNICQQILRRHLDQYQDINQNLIRIYFQLIRRQMLRETKATEGLEGPSKQVPFLFRLIKRDPQKSAAFFKEMFSKDVPSRLFLGWEQQLISFLKPEFQFLSRDILGRLIVDFPHLVVYNLYFNKDNPEVQKLMDQFAPFLESYFGFIEGLLDLNDPELEFNEQAATLKKLLDKVTHSNPKMVNVEFRDLPSDAPEFKDLFERIRVFNEFLEQMLQKCEAKQTKVYCTFRKVMERELREIRRLLSEGTLKTLNKKMMSTIKKMNASLKGKMESNKFLVEDYSPKLGVYCQFFYDKILSLETGKDYKMLGFPFQSPSSKTLRIKRVLPEMKVMDSYKKPKRITVLLHNNEERHILIKFGEDLRTDSRIQKVFDLVNACLDNDHFGEDALGCFGVHPLTPDSGFLEWIQDSLPLSHLVSEGMEKGKYNDNRAISKYKELLSQTKAVNDNLAHLELFNQDDQTVAFYFDDEARIIGQNSLKKSFLKKSKSAVEFFEIRKKFIRDYALVCAIGYILGIGDRHCDNLMLTSEGRVYLIDFACCFGQGLHLAVPETVPFRLTPNLVEMMKPFGGMGSFRSHMVKAMRNILAHRWTLTDYISIYAGTILIIVDHFYVC
jgi:hypothetical protein